MLRGCRNLLGEEGPGHHGIDHFKESEVWRGNDHVHLSGGGKGPRSVRRLLALFGGDLGKLLERRDGACAGLPKIYNASFTRN